MGEGNLNLRRSGIAELQGSWLQFIFLYKYTYGIYYGVTFVDLSLSSKTHWATTLSLNCYLDFCILCFLISLSVVLLIFGEWNNSFLLN